MCDQVCMTFIPVHGGVRCASVPNCFFEPACNFIRFFVKLPGMSLLWGFEESSYPSSFYRCNIIVESNTFMFFTETPATVMEALHDMGYSSFRPGQEHTVMRILSGKSIVRVFGLLFEGNIIKCSFVKSGMIRL